MKNNFVTYHPLVNLIYFVAVIGFSVIILNPYFLAVSFVCAFIYSVYLGGGTSLKFNFCLALPILLLSTILNPIINTRGMTVLFEGPLGPVTVESIIYGFTTGLMISSIIMWFVCFNIIITSDKITYLFGRILPSSSLIFVMILRFIPRYREQIKKISQAQQSIGMGANEGPLKVKLKNGMRILSIMFVWALENAIQTSDSMKARGYGQKNRTSFMKYKFTFSDKLTIVLILAMITGVICAFAAGALNAEFFPLLSFGKSDTGHAGQIMGISGVACFMILSLLPVFISLKEIVFFNDQSGAINE